MPSQRITSAATGCVSNSAATPQAAATSIDANPNGTPSMCGTAARKPKFAPVSVAMVVLGPGVNEPTNANTASAMT